MEDLPEEMEDYEIVNYEENNKKESPVGGNYIQPNYPQLPERQPHDWQYLMRRTMQEIIPNVYLGPYAAATKSQLNSMLQAGLTHVVCVRLSVEKNLVRANHPEHFRYLVREFGDSPLENIIPHVKEVNDFIQNSLDGGGKVLVHGNGGISRSAALVVAYVMASHGVTLRVALDHVQSRRFCVSINEGFMCQLREFEPIYKAMHVVPKPLEGRPSQKRTLDENEYFEDGPDERPHPPQPRPNPTLKNPQQNESQMEME